MAAVRGPLSRADVVQTCGTEKLDEVEELEVLFTSCDEPGGFEVSLSHEI
jgi:hypothetical protein